MRLPRLKGAQICTHERSREHERLIAELERQEQEQPQYETLNVGLSSGRLWRRS
jgi:hypothetical protein